MLFSFKSVFAVVAVCAIVAEAQQGNAPEVSVTKSANNDPSSRLADPGTTVPPLTHNSPKGSSSEATPGGSEESEESNANPEKISDSLSNRNSTNGSSSEATPVKSEKSTANPDKIRESSKSPQKEPVKNSSSRHGEVYFLAISSLAVLLLSAV